MPSLEESFDTACKDGAIPGAILLAADKTGNHETNGLRSVWDVMGDLTTVRLIHVLESLWQKIPGLRQATRDEYDIVDCIMHKTHDVYRGYAMR